MVVGIQRQRALVCRCRLVELVLVEQHRGEMHEQLFVARLDGERAAHEIGGFVEPLEVFERQRQIVERVGIVRRELERLAIDGLRFLGSLELAQTGAEIVPGVGEARL